MSLIRNNYYRICPDREQSDAGKLKKLVWVIAYLYNSTEIIRLLFVVAYVYGEKGILE